MIINLANDTQIISNFDSNTGILHTEYSGFFNLDLALNYFHLVEEFAKSNALKGAINDLTNLTGSYNKVIEYLKNENFPKLKKLGLQSEAFIISDDIIIEYLTDKLSEILKTEQIKAGVFKDYKDAQSWMLDSFK